MSTTRSLLRTRSDHTHAFIQEFGFYLDSVDHAFSLQARIGLDVSALSALPEQEQNEFKTYLFLAESVNTTTLGALQLFAGNVFCDAFALLRIMYEAAALMHYGNQSAQNRSEVYRALFKSGMDSHDHHKGEWAMVRKATSKWESENPELMAVRRYLNNYGAHMSRAKIVLGNVAALGNQSASTVFTDNTRRPEFVMGLDMLHSLFMKVLEEYDKQAASHHGASPSLAQEIASHNTRFLSEIRPRLQRRVGVQAN